MVAKRSGRVEQATSEHQDPRRYAGMDPHLRERKTGCPAQPDERRADQQLWCAHPGQVDTTGGDPRGSVRAGHQERAEHEPNL
jgi:hypothetical protein